jgi:hypothetical protein
MAQADNILSLPAPDPEELKRALECAEASRWESDPEARKALEQAAMRHWHAAYAQRRAAMYRRGRS